MRNIVIVTVLAAATLGVTGCTGSADPQPTQTAASIPASSRPSSEATETAPAMDSGPTDAANGTVTGGGGSFTYWVAAGDAVTGIAARFGLCTADIYLANQDPDILGHELAVGQQLTIARVAGPGHESAECAEPYPVGVS